MVGGLQPMPPAQRCETVRDPTGLPVRRCSLIIAASTACPRASGVQSDWGCNVEARLAMRFGVASGASGFTGAARMRRFGAATAVYKLFRAATPPWQELNFPRPRARALYLQTEGQLEYSGFRKTRANGSLPPSFGRAQPPRSRLIQRSGRTYPAASSTT